MEEWNGKYTISAISALEHIALEEKIRKRMGKKQNVDLVFYKGLSLLVSVRKDGEKLAYEEPEELLSKMPNRLYLILYNACDKLNNIKPEDQRFLSTV